MTLFDYEEPILTTPTLRDWQAKAIPKMLGFMRNNDKIVLCIPTGCGKTVAAGVIIADYVKRGKKVLFVVDRLVLIQQTIESFASLGIRCDILQGMNSTHTNAPVIVASQQTLVRRDLPTELSAVFADECHVLSGAFKKIINELDIPVVGLSATPFTKGMSKIFNRLYNPYTTKQATDDGVLVPLKVIECVKMDMSNAKKIGGEYSDHDVEEKGIEIIGDVVAEYKRYANNKAIAFCATIKQCMALSDELNANGVPSAIFCATTTAEERKEILRLYNNTNEIMVLVSVAALATGFDARCIKTVLDCRPLSRSLSLYIQSIGRGLRSMDGKESCLLLDFTGNMRKFSADFVDFYLNGIDSLNSGEKKDRTRKEEPEKPKKDGNGCPECQSSLWVRANNTMHCLACGYEVKPDIEKFETQKVDYKTQELDIFKAAKKGETNRELWVQLSNYVTKDKDLPTYDKAKALKKCMAIYKQITGSWQKWGQPLTPSKDGKISHEVWGKITQLNIAYVKSRTAA